ncbi:hypothetical protein SPRG_14441 [Saprolegnia parasitica CBS 223.65]|uniref:Uncharacterized protein n=1 Tax=Saprolegnia parasitica (strain CBS 223.65) TaxID=695850 RepID=A0A067C179_SAPPC|nr:hypothetical protein SPRG_14441 [Saprolegnia parasitica CBS 223.65]KDO20306.1 hypothetical protein SPRG_14441 [Saprolegnia parasitica CBS 223.65]|eukprot:XP_012208975.1 hypothetical protein SPRG_14441 [Saprolegnia parasitica CBS 223.65]
MTDAAAESDLEISFIASPTSSEPSFFRHDATPRAFIYPTSAQYQASANAPIRSNNSSLFSSFQSETPAQDGPSSNSTSTSDDASLSADSNVLSGALLSGTTSDVVLSGTTSDVVGATTSNAPSSTTSSVPTTVDGNHVLSRPSADVAQHGVFSSSTSSSDMPPPLSASSSHMYYEEESGRQSLFLPKHKETISEPLLNSNFEPTLLAGLEEPFFNFDFAGDDDSSEASFKMPLVGGASGDESSQSEQHPTFYYDDSSYEDNVNIWASRVWTSRSETEGELESYLHAMELARVQMQKAGSTKPESEPYVMTPIEEHAARCSLEVEAMDDGLKPPPSPLRTPSYLARTASPVDLRARENAILSPYLQQKQAAQTLQWFDAIFLMPHEALRHALVRIRRLISIDYIPFHMSWKVDLFFDWFAEFALFVKTAIEIKRTVVVPRVVQRKPALATSLAVTMEGYDATLAVLDAIKYFHNRSYEEESDVSKAGMLWATYLLQLTEYLGTVERLVLANLDKDEVDLSSALAVAYTHRTYLAELQKPIEEALNEQAKRVMVPWMLDARQFGFKGDLQHWQWGWFSKWLYEHRWRPYYETHVEGLLTRIEFASTTKG